MKIQLDTNAVLALFPEGSEAHLELQNAVIAEVVKKAVAGKFQSKITEDWKKTIDSHLSTFFKSHTFGKLSLNTQGKQEVQSAVRECVNQFFSEVGATSIETYVDMRVKEAIRAGMAGRIFDTLTEERISKLVDIRLAAKFRSLG